MGLEKVSD